MNVDALKDFRLGLTSFPPILDTLDFTEESHKYQFEGILEYFAIFTGVIESGKTEGDQDVIDCIPLYVEFAKSMNRCLDIQIKKLVDGN